MSTTRDNIVKPWLFQKGNQPMVTGGRSKWTASLRDLARGMVPQAMAVVQMIMNDPDSPASARLQAAGMIWDRACGKPEQSISVEKFEDRDIQSLTTLELKKMLLQSIGKVEVNEEVIEGEVSHDD